MKRDVTDLAGYLLAGDYNSVWSFLKSQGELSRLEIFQEWMTPAMQHIGTLWERNEITVADEHLATATCDFVLSRFVFTANKSSGSKRAMFLCLEGEQHYLGLKMVSSLFDEKGWETKYFGPNLPLEYAMKTAREWEPHVIGLSVSIVYHLPHLKKYITELDALPNRPTILLGSRLTEKYDLLSYCSERTRIMKDLHETRQWLENYHLEDQMNAIS